MMTKTTSRDVLKKDVFLNTGIMEMWDPERGDYVTCAGFENLSLETTQEAKEPEPVAGGVAGERIVRQDLQAVCELKALRSPWVLKNLFGITEQNRAIGEVVTVTDEVITADVLDRDEKYAAMIPNIDWRGDMVLISKVALANGTALKKEDYSLKIINGYTAVIVDGASRGETLKVSYTYAPLVSVSMAGGQPKASMGRKFRFSGVVHGDVPAKQQENLTEIVMEEADIVSGVKWQFMSQESADEPRSIELEIQSRKGTPWNLKFVKRIV